MKITTVVTKTFKIRDLGMEALEFILDDCLDEDYELKYDDLATSEKIAILQTIENQFKQAISNELKEILKNACK